MAKKAEPKPEFLTVPEVADRLRVARMSVYRMCESGTLPHVRIGKQYRIEREGFEQWLAAQRRGPGRP